MPLTLSTDCQTKTVGDTRYALVTPVGQIDEENLDDFCRAVDPFLDSEHTYLVFDLGRLDFMNTKVIGYLINTHEQLMENNRRMIFVNANQNILEILELVGLVQVVPIFEKEKHFLLAIEEGEL